MIHFPKYEPRTRVKNKVKDNKSVGKINTWRALLAVLDYLLKSKF